VGGPSRRNRTRKEGRRAAFRDPKVRILAVCEGEATEPEYLEGFADVCHNPLVEVATSPGAGIPKSVVEEARDRMRSAREAADRHDDDNLAFDQVWAVFDVDDHPAIGEAKQTARDNGIFLAISNPCIELWLLLHFRDNPGMQHREQMRVMLKDDFVAGYDKHVNYSIFRDGYLEAVKRAARMQNAADAAGEGNRNPTTGFFQLTEAIRCAVK
jgi:hypothetical protein